MLKTSIDWLYPGKKREVPAIHLRHSGLKKSVVAAVCDRRVLFISTAWSALIERRYNFFTPS